MSDSLPQWEIEDRQGSLEVYSSTVGTSWTAVPSVASTLIQEFAVINPDSNLFTSSIDVSIDGGTTTLFTIYPNGFVSHEIKGDLTQIWIKASAVSTSYKVILEKESVSP
jgi:hypothetical protein